MKSFLDRFRRKEGAEDPSAAPASPVSGTPKSPKPGDPDFNKNNQTLDIEETEDGPGFKPDLVDSSVAKRASAGGNGAAESSPDDDLVLELGDFLHRIPHHLLKGGAHDTHLPLHFDLGEVADRVARGETTIPLTELYRRAPQIFQNEILSSDNVDIRFPWQKVIHMINASAGAAQGSGAGAAASLAHRLRSRRGVARNIGNEQPAVAKAPSGAKQPAAKQLSWFTRPGATDSPLGPKPVGAPLAPASRNPAGSKTTLPSKPPATGTPKDADLTIPPIVDDPRLLREEILRARDAAVLQLAHVRGDYEWQIALLHQDRDEWRREQQKLAGSLEEARVQHEQALQALKKERDDLRTRGEALQTELVGVRKEGGQLKTDLDAQTKKSAAEKDSLSKDLAAAQAELKKIGAALEEQRSIVANAKKESDQHAAARKEIESKVILAITAERDRMISEITGDASKNQAAAEAERQTLTRDRDETHRRLAETEVRLASETQRLITERDAAQREVKSLIERLTAIGTESERVRENLTHERDAHVVEKRILAAALEEAKESHKAESATFSRELRAVMKQRDEALADLGAARSEAQQKAAALERERSALVLAQNEAKAQAEREITRFRRDRDAVVQQRDELRRRISQLIAQQRQLLDDLQPHPAAMHQAAPEPPGPAPVAAAPAPAPGPRQRPIPRPAPFVAAKVEPVSEPVVPVEKMKTPRTRPPRVKNIIDVGDAEVVQEAAQETGRNIPLPRVRPVSITPPQVQTLG